MLHFAIVNYCLYFYCRYWEYYASNTSIHGLQYLVDPAAQPWHKAAWVMIMLILWITGATFVVEIFEGYSAHEVVVNTRLEAGLDDVHFPVVTVCNINRFGQSYWAERGMEFKTSEIQTVEGLTDSEIHNDGRPYPETLEIIGWSKDSETELLETFPFAAMQPCNDLFLGITYAGNQLSMTDMERVRFKDAVPGPYMKKTDAGLCCSFHPHLDFDESSDRKGQVDVLDEIKYSAEESLEFLVDVEAYNYATSNDRKSETGIYFALHDVKDRPIIRQSGITFKPNSDIDIKVGFERPVYTPVLIDGSTVEERSCISNDEALMDSLSEEVLYSYSRDNCILNAAYRLVVEECDCTDTLEQVESSDKPPCSGIKVACAASTFQRVMMDEDLWRVDVEERKERKEKHCMPGCESVRIKREIIQAPLASNTDLRQIMLKKILEKTCKDEEKRITMESRYSNLCSDLLDVRVYGLEQDNYLFDTANLTYPEKRRNQLFEYLDKYREDNILRLRVGIAFPEVTVADYSLKMSRLDLVSTTGGTIGLMVGFSITSFFELIFICCTLGYGREESEEDSSV